MKKIQLRYYVLMAALLAAPMLFAQDWVTLMHDPNANFFDVQKAFYKQYGAKEQEMMKERISRINKPYKAEDETDEIPGYSQFKRWEWFMAPRVSATGERPNPSQVWQEMEKYNRAHSSNRSMTTGAGNWSFIGPSNTSALAGAGRLNFVRIHPTDPNTLFVGSPSGGLWKSTDAGATWSTVTDHIAQVIGASDLAIDPNNTNIMYLATGDGDAGDNYSVGVLKSTDGGATWNTTGLSIAIGTSTLMSRVMISPSNSNVVMVASSAGIYRSTDAGATFTRVLTGGFKDMEFKPGDANYVYVCGTSFYRSIDNGVNWTLISSGLPAAAAVGREVIAVTPADPTIVWLMAGGPTPNYGIQGFYKSANSGASFTHPSTPTGYDLSTPGQEWYDFPLAANPTNTTEIISGAQNLMRSQNGGTSFSNINGSSHVDYHDAVYANGTTVYITSDGGIFKSTNNGGTWTNLNHNLAISQMYGFGQSTSTTSLFIQGWQDNGTNIDNGGTWNATMGGDGMLAFIARTSNSNMWGSQYNGALNRSTNGGGSWSTCTPGSAGTGAWVTPWKEDPVTANTIYAGYVNMWKSTNGGVSWTQAGTIAGNAATITQFAISPANNQVIWVTTGAKLYKTTNGGGAWTQVTTIPPGSISYITCSNTDANKAWITFSGFTSVYKVYKTTNQGTTWTDAASLSLPNIPIDCITYVNGSNDALYLGTDVGAYYIDNTFNVWQPFSNGLPNVIVSQIEIYYATNKIRCSTYGRGMWESDAYASGNYPPAASFAASEQIACPGAAIQFTDYSSGSPTSWSWTFNGGNPALSNAQNPLVTYNTPGTYLVSLTVTNANGSDTRTVNSYVTVSAPSVAAPTANPSNVNFCAPGTVNLAVTPAQAGTVRWWDASGGGNLVNTGNTYSPSLSGTTTFYVDEDFPGGGNPDVVGETDNSIGAGAFFTANDIRGDYFDVLQPVILRSVQVYANTAGVRTIEIIDPVTGDTYIDTTLNIPANPNVLQTIMLNFRIYPGTGYFIKCRGYVDLYRNSAGANFPYTSSAINITGTNAGDAGYYYFFYNWDYTTFECNTSRTAVSATDTCSTVGIGELPGISGLSIYPNPNNGKFSLEFNSDVKDNYVIKMTNAVGQLVHEERLAGFASQYSKLIDVTAYGKGMYMLSITNSRKETVRKVVVY
jgi:PKD repeat protein